MATAVCQREKVGTWQSIFPQDQLTEQNSAFFVKKLLAVSVSYLTYLRNVFPESAFGNRYLDDLNLKILQESSSCIGANKVCQWVRSCFDALDKKFLNSLVLGLYIDPTDANTLLESYSFKFNYEDGIDIYHNDKKIMTSEADNTKKSTTTLLRTILVLTQGLKPLPDNVMLTMKLFFNDDVTPADYHPTGFIESETEDFTYDDDTVNIKVGDIRTKFHTVKLRIRTKCHNFDLSPDTKEIVAELSDGSQNSGENSKKSADTSPAEGMEEDGSVESAFLIDCICGSTVQDGLLLQCVECDKWSHAVCYKIINEEFVPEAHVCVKCPGQCTDRFIKSKEPVVAKATALWRRALLALTEVKRVKDLALSQRLHIDLEVAKELVKRLKQERYIKIAAKGGLKNGYIVNKLEIEERGFRTYFSDEAESLSQLYEESVDQKVTRGAEKSAGEVSTYEETIDQKSSQDDRRRGERRGGEKRKLARLNGDSVDLSRDLSSSQNGGKRLRSAETRTPVRVYK